MTKKKLIVLSAGGTGGHLFPAQALAEELFRNKYNLLLVHDQRVEDLKQGIFQKIPFFQIESHRLTGGFISKIKTIYAILHSIFKLRSYFKKIKPSCVVGFGGYASFAASAAAVSLGIPLYIQEQNSVLGKTNRLLQFFAEKIFTTFVSTQKLSEKSYLKAINNGWFVRKNIRALLKSEEVKKSKKFKILVIGGSQGSKILSDVVPQALLMLSDEIQKNIEVNQQARPEMMKGTIEAYEGSALKVNVSPFFENIAQMMFEADLVICRSGSSTIGEIIALKKPSILVPFAKSEDDHQYFNALELAQENAAVMIEEKDLAPKRLLNNIKTLMNDEQAMQDLRDNIAYFDQPDGIQKTVEIITK